MTMIKDGAVVAGVDPTRGFIAYKKIDGQWVWDNDMIEQMKIWIKEYEESQNKK